MNGSPVSDMMNSKSAMPPAVRPDAPKAVDERTTITVDVAKEKKRKFDVFPATNCKNRAHIMSSYIRKISKFECQSKCAFDPSCTGYDIETTAQNEGECTIFKGSCDRVNDNGHDLFIEQQAETRDLEKAPAGQDFTKNQAAAAPTANLAQADTSAKMDNMLNLTIVIPTVRRFQKDGSPAP